MGDVIMGYFIEMTGSNFVIKKENFEKALESLKSVFVPENMNCYDYINGKEIPHFSWVETDDVLESKTIGEALREIRYAPEYDNEGNICNVEFTNLSTIVFEPKYVSINELMVDIALNLNSLTFIPY